MTDDFHLGALLCSRLCHDLISPVGAIGNGMELLLAEPDGDREEYALIGDSVAAARAALTFYRVAFGAAANDAPSMSLGQLERVSSEYLAGGRARADWPGDGEALPRPAAKLLLLMLLAGVSALPLGGRLAVASPRSSPLALEVVAEGRRAELSAEAERALVSADAPAPAEPRTVHLAVAQRLAATLGAALSVTREHERIRIAAAG